MNSLIIVEASLEIVPRKYRNSSEAKSVAMHFGVPPSMQILDRNFHSNIAALLSEDREKRGRPDVVHFALLDATSTPLFFKNKLRVYVHTRDDFVIQVANETRLPRTLQRFCGVMAKLISDKAGKDESQLFTVSKNSFEDLISSINPDKVVSLSTQGNFTSLRELVTRENARRGSIVWIVGGFPHGHFKDEISQSSDLVVSVSKNSLPAHVVTGRLCYELEKDLGIE